MQPHQQRVMLEAGDLNMNILKLREFFETPIFKALDPEEQDRLERQAGHMTAYLNVLFERIDAF